MIKIDDESGIDIDPYDLTGDAIDLGLSVDKELVLIKQAIIELQASVAFLAAAVAELEER